MNLSRATTVIEQSLNTLTSSAGEPIFDEWIILGKKKNQWTELHYVGPRMQEHVASFSQDLRSLVEVFDPSVSEVGDFSFTHKGHGTAFDAFMCIGPEIFVLFNHTQKNTDQITQNPKWTEAQVYFTELLEAFIADPVV